MSGDEKSIESRVAQLETKIDYILPKIERALDVTQTRMNEQFEIIRTALHDIEKEDRSGTCPKKTEIAANAKGLFEVREEIERVEKRLDEHISEPAKEALEQKRGDAKAIRGLVIASGVGFALAKGPELIKAIITGGPK